MSQPIDGVTNIITFTRVSDNANLLTVTFTGNITGLEGASVLRRMVESRNVLVARPHLCLDMAQEMAAIRAKLDTDGPPR